MEQREKERGNRIQGSARGQFHKIHVDATYDLEIDTHRASIRENTEKIKLLALYPFSSHRARDKNSDTAYEALIKWLEDLASQEGYDHIGIGVSLYREYGPAQKLYFQLGYTPDGNGITYKGQPTIAGQTYPLDDELILWLEKSLGRR